MLVRFTKNRTAAGADAYSCTRPNGTTTRAEMTRQGTLPHEAIHFVVESTLGWHDAFFGRIARGASAAETTEKLHSLPKSGRTDPQAQQAEALVACLGKEQWAGPTDPAAFAEHLVQECRRRGVPPPDITADEVERVRTALREFGAQWRPLPPGASIERTF